MTDGRCSRPTIYEECIVTAGIARGLVAWVPCECPKSPRGFLDGGKEAGGYVARRIDIGRRSPLGEAERILGHRWGVVMPAVPSTESICILVARSIFAAAPYYGFLRANQGLPSAAKNGYPDRTRQ
jgi:hypothetical protein